LRKKTLEEADPGFFYAQGTQRTRNFYQQMIQMLQDSADD